MNLRHLSLSVAAILLLSACSGSDDTSSDGPEGTSNSYLAVIANPLSHTTAELKSAYDQKINSDYTGNIAAADLTLEHAQQINRIALGEDNPGFFGIGSTRLKEYLSVGESVNPMVCDIGGQIKFVTHSGSGNEASIEVIYENCDFGYGVKNVNGSELIKLINFTDEDIEFTSFYADMSFQHASSDKQYKSSGYVTRKINDQYQSLSRFDYYLMGNAIFDSAGDEEQLTIEFEYQNSFEAGSEVGFDKGVVKTSQLGAVSYSSRWESLDYYNSNEELIFSGQQSIKITESTDGTTLIYLDNNNDGVYELASFIASLNQFDEMDLASLNFSDPNELTSPPRADQPYLISYSPTVLTGVEVEEGYYSDPDTPTDELTVSFNWYLNGELLDDYKTAVLPPNVAAFGDELSVSMVVKDDKNVTESSKTQITIIDSPGEINFSELPSQINTGETVNFSVTVSDPDLINSEESVAAKYISGPTGAVLDDLGTITWQAPDNLIFPVQAYQFTFENPNNSEQVLDVEVNVVNGQSSLTARSGIEVPYRNYSMWVDDFDGDGTNEILSTDSKHRVFIISEDGGEYKQTWLYPYKMPFGGDIKQILTAQIDDDAEVEIIVVNEKGISVIDGLNSTAKPIIAADFIGMAAIADSNLDGELELAYLEKDSDYGSSGTIKVVSLAEPDILIAELEASEVGEMLFGNVDNDDALELVLNTGLVYDGSTWVNEWFKGTSFGTSLVLGDLNGDEKQEIIGINRWDNTEIFSADTKETWEISNFVEMCSAVAQNIDDDPADELIVNGCSWDTPQAYDFIDGSFVRKWQTSNYSSGNIALVAGDSDNDGIVELHWGSGQDSTGADHFRVIDVTADGSSATERTLDNQVQLDNFQTIGWTENSEGNQAAVFFVPSTQSGYSGSRFLTFDALGNERLSDEIGSNWDNSRYAAITDFNNDGVDDLFVPSTDLYDGSLAILNIQDESVHWEISGDYDDDIGVILAVDLNGDDNDDVLYSNGRKIKALDAMNQVLLGSFDASSNIKDFEVTDYNNSKLIAVSSDKTRLLTKTLTGFTAVASMDTVCSRLVFANLDDDAEQELVCIEGDYYYYSDSNTLIVYDFVNNQLIEKSRQTYEKTIIDISVDTSSASNQELFITTSEEEGYRYDYGVYRIEKVSSEGKLIWKSPALVGKPTHRGLKVSFDEENKLKLLLSTSKAMYMMTE